MVESYHEIGVATVNFCGEGHANMGPDCLWRNHSVPPP